LLVPKYHASHQPGILFGIKCRPNISFQKIKQKMTKLYVVLIAIVLCLTFANCYRYRSYRPGYYDERDDYDYEYYPRQRHYPRRGYLSDYHNTLVLEERTASTGDGSRVVRASTSDGFGETAGGHVGGHYGALAGAKTGALVGALGGPIGSGIGAAVGAAVGAFVGVKVGEKGGAKLDKRHDGSWYSTYDFRPDQTGGSLRSQDAPHLYQF
jgi:hypothetical protein